MRSLIAALFVLGFMGCLPNKANPHIGRGTDMALPAPSYDAADLAKMLLCRADTASARQAGKAGSSRDRCSGFGRDSSSTTAKDPSTPATKVP
jgi:hypothetical protein